MKIISTLLFATLIAMPLLGQVPLSTTYGDLNGDDKISLIDIIFLVNYIFKSGPPSNPKFLGDCNADNRVNLSDIVYLVNYIFKGGRPPQDFDNPPDTSKIMYDSNLQSWLISNRAIVVFDDTVAWTTVKQLIDSLGGKVVGELTKEHAFLIEADSIEQLINSLSSNQRVVGVGHDLIPEYLGSQEPPVAKPNDPHYFYYQQDDLLQIRAPLAWGIEAGDRDIVIGVIETGAITLGHPDINYAGAITVLPDNYVRFSEHLTRVCGIIAATTNNNEGVSGLVWNPYVVVLNRIRKLSQGEDIVGHVKMIRYLTKLAAEIGKNLVLNMSFGYKASDPSNQEQLAEVENVGRLLAPVFIEGWSTGRVIFVAAAGNGRPNIDPQNPGFPIIKGYAGEGDSASKMYPASLPEVLAVGVVDKLDKREPISNYGENVLCSPGNWWTITLDSYDRTGAFTSFAAPVVTSIVALVWSLHPQYDNETVKSLFLQSSDHNILSAGEFGFGRVNAYRTLKLSNGEPQPENKLPGTPMWANPPSISGDSKVILNWNPPTVNYDSTSLDDGIGGFHIYRKLSSESGLAWQQITNTNTPWPSSSYTDEGLVNGQSYDYMISAVDVAGQEGYQSSAVSATPRLYNILVYCTSKTNGYFKNSFDTDLPTVLTSGNFVSTVTDRQLTPTLTSELLNSYDELWILATARCPSSSPFTADELMAITNFHSAGKGILIMADDTNYQCTADQVANSLGAEFTGFINRCGKMWGSDFANHFLFQGVDTLRIFISEGNVNIVDITNVIPVASYPGNVVVAARDDGITGRVVFDGSFTRLWDFEVTDDGPCRQDVLYLSNSQYAKNIAMWLSPSKPSLSFILGYSAKVDTMK